MYQYRKVKWEQSFIIFVRYLPQNPADQKETCRSSQKITYIYSYIHTISDENFLSVDNAQKFLREMRKSSGSKCNCLPGEHHAYPPQNYNCLPDCELFDIQHSVSTTNFMWVILFMLSVSTVLIPIKRPCDSRNLNLNPLCMLETGTLPKLWTNRVNNKILNLKTINHQT